MNMSIPRHMAFACVCLMLPSAAIALQPKAYSDSTKVKEGTVIVTGDQSRSGQLISVMYDVSDRHHTEPTSPRFLFFDRQGKVLFGIGGYVKGTMQYDFGGAIDDGASFTTYDIPVPNDPSQRNQFFANANHSTIFLQLIGRSERFGLYQMYIQTNFSGGGNTGYGLKLKQAYLTVGYVTAGLTNSTFIDGSAGTPVIDDQGPSGELGNKNILVRYAPRFSEHLSAAIGIEGPKASMTIPTDESETTSPKVKKINQRVPDIPVYLQYSWGDDNHVRMSALLRDLSYRDLVAEKNRFKLAWAVQLSGHFNPVKSLTLFYQGSYGRGYGQYVNDLSGSGFDLVESTDAGRMTAPRTATYELGLQYNFLKNFSMSACYSQARLFGVSHLGPDTYRYGQYISVSSFYDIFNNLRVGLEYLHGDRANVDRSHGRANRLIGMLRYNF